MRQEVTAGEVTHKGLVDRCAIEGEVVDILGQRQFGNADLIADRACLFLGDFGGSSVLLEGPHPAVDVGHQEDKVLNRAGKLVEGMVFPRFFERLLFLFWGIVLRFESAKPLELEHVRSR